MIRVSNLSSVGIIYRESNPDQVFIETKTPGYPRKVMVGKGLLPGGNWVGKAATNDGGPLGTYIREIREELSFDNPSIEPEEMDEVFGTGHLGHAPEIRSVTASAKDIALLDMIKNNIEENAKPFGIYLEYVPRWVFDSADPENKAGDFIGALSVFEVPLPEDIWGYLSSLQNTYLNLSSESQTVMTAVDQLVAKGWKIGWGQDRVLQEHFLRHGFKEAVEMSLMCGISAIKIGTPMKTYAEYFKLFDVEKIPEGVERPVLV